MQLFRINSIVANSVIYNSYERKKKLEKLFTAFLKQKVCWLAIN